MLVGCRHAESQENVAHTALHAGDYGQYLALRSAYVNPNDCKLTPKGRGQADALGKSLKAFVARHQGHRRVVVYVSPYQRAQETCEIAMSHLGDHQLTVVHDLRERSWGELASEVHWEDRLAAYFEHAKRAVTDTSYRPPGGESIVDRLAGIKRLVDAWEQEQSDETINIAYSHGETLRLIRHCVERIPLDHWTTLGGMHNCHSVAYSRRCPRQLVHPRFWYRTMVHCSRQEVSPQYEWQALWTPQP